MTFNSENAILLNLFSFHAFLDPCDAVLCTPSQKNTCPEFDSTPTRFFFTRHEVLQTIPAAPKESDGSRILQKIEIQRINKKTIGLIKISTT